MDFSKFGDIISDRNKALTKFKGTLTKTQKQRFLEIEIQQATKNTDPAIFVREEVQTGLKFDAKLKKLTKTTTDELDKDVKEINDDAKGDFKAMFEARGKINKLNKEAYTKITKALSDDQKKSWKTMAGKEFELKMDFGGKKGKFGKKKKDDD
jgi:hypothetical protein